MDIGLKSAFIISAMIHAGVAVPFYNHNLIKSDFEKKNAVIVDYVILKELSNITPANIAKKESVVTPQAPKEDIKSAPAENKTVSKRNRQDYRKRLEALRAREKSAATQKAMAKQAETDKKEAQLKSKKDYIDYYGLIKEKMRVRLQENYKFYKGEGEVCLSFVLNAKGTLIGYDIDRSKSSKDEVLLQITRASLTAVSPFGPMPKAISAPQMSFSITISFKK